MPEPTTELDQDTGEVLLLALLERASNGTQDEEGNFDEETKQDLEAIASLAERPEELAKIMQEASQGEEEPAEPSQAKGLRNSPVYRRM